MQQFVPANPISCVKQISRNCPLKRNVRSAKMIIARKYVRQKEVVKMQQYIACDLKSYYSSVECVDRGLDPLKSPSK